MKDELKSNIHVHTHAQELRRGLKINAEQLCSWDENWSIQIEKVKDTIADNKKEMEKVKNSQREVKLSQLDHEVKIRREKEKEATCELSQQLIEK